jgi:negative regulator of flagellin synthesis FlgM
VKIDKPSKPLPANSAGEVAAHVPAKGKSSPATSSSQPASSTSVSLGSTAAQLNSMESNMVNTPVVDAGKVASIKQAISEGRFKVNSGVVADRLIETVRDLIVGKA